MAFEDATPAPQPVIPALFRRCPELRLVCGSTPHFPAQLNRLIPYRKWALSSQTVAFAQRIQTVIAIHAR
jgi:hypothetical protein